MTAPGLLRRLAAMLYDALLLLALLMIATLLLQLVFTGGEAVTNRIVMQVWVLALAFAFFGGFWTHGGQTLGMKAWRIRVERLDGAPLTWRDALNRFALAIPSIGLAGIGLWWMVCDRDRLALHDRWSQTRLVLVPRA